MKDQELFEMFVGLRQMLRAMLSQVSWAIEEMKKPADDDELEDQQQLPNKPKTFGRSEELLDAQKQ